ncbi:MAG TPA: S41 family peptidase [Daejeonella sp.]|nr:S41 family peptidase [Daejeonella sp.]
MFKSLKHGSLKISVFIIGILLFATACKKDPKIVPDPVSPVPATRDQLTKDSIFLYAKDTYYWNTALPTYDVFKARSFSDFDLELDAIKKYKIDPSTGKAIDKYSFLDDGTLSDELGGLSGDYGFAANFNNGDRSDLRVRYVYQNSPAGLQNLSRGDRITKINGRTNIDGNSQANVDFLNAALFGNNPSISLTVTKKNGSTADVVVNRGSYSINPILFTNVYTVGSKKVGYVVFSSFTTNSSARLDEVFTKFTAEGVSEVIVDLRYNGGGSVSTAEHLSNLIAPASATGKVMYTTYWTKTMQDGQATILKNQKFWGEGNDGVYRWYSFYDYNYKPTEAAGNVSKFEKKGAANISKAYFIVTGSTASASELVINNLKPVMDVKLIGRKTYGKPVGFFALSIDNLDLYIPQFETKNSLDQGGYFDGMAVDKDDFDDIGRDFGDPQERLLANALSHSEKGSFLAVKPGADRISSLSPVVKEDVERINQQLNKHDFKGMVEKRLPKLKPNL